MPNAPASVETRNAISDLLERMGSQPAADCLGVSRETLFRLIAGVPVRAGTHALLRERLAALVLPSTNAA